MAPRKVRRNKESYSRQKRRIVNTLVKKVTIGDNRELHVEIGSHPLNFFDDDSANGFEGKNNTRGYIEPARVSPGRRYNSRSASAFVCI